MEPARCSVRSGDEIVPGFESDPAVETNRPSAAGGTMTAVAWLGVPVGCGAVVGAGVAGDRVGSGVDGAAVAGLDAGALGFESAECDPRAAVTGAPCGLPPPAASDPATRTQTTRTAAIDPASGTECAARHRASGPGDPTRPLERNAT